MDFIKFKNFYSTIDPVKGIRAQITYGQKILVNHVSNKGLVPEIKNSENPPPTTRKRKSIN